MLPRAKILSPQSNHKTNQTTNQTVNVILPQSDIKPAIDDISNTTPPPPPQPIEETNPYQNLDTGAVHYPTRDVKLDEPADKLTHEDATSTITFLKLVLESYMNNPIKYNGYIICSVPLLEHLIEVITSCDDCDVDIAVDPDGGCCGTSSKIKIIPISKIWVHNGDRTELFKYKYSQFLQVFEQYRISLKFVYVE